MKRSIFQALSIFHNSCFTLSSAKATSTALHSIRYNSSSGIPQCFCTSSISLERVVPLTVRLSVFNVTRSPSSRNSLMGYCSQLSTAWVCRLLTGHISMPVLCLLQTSMISFRLPMAIPWPTLAAPSSTAPRMFSALPHSPAWMV